MVKVNRETELHEKLIDLPLAKALFNAGTPQKSKWYWMYNDIGKFWDCVHHKHLKQYNNLEGLKFYSAFKKNKIGCYC